MADLDAAGLFDVRVAPPLSDFLERTADFAPADQAAGLLRIARQENGWQELLDDGIGDMARTTIAFTMCEGASAANVLPRRAWVVCNIRIEPGKTVAETLAALEERARPYDVELELLQASEPSAVSDAHSPDFARVERAVRCAYPDTPVAPFLLSGGTDTKHFAGISRTCLRFTPLHISAEQARTMHGVDENVDLAALPHAVDFFRALITGSPSQDGGARLAKDGKRAPEEDR